MQPMGMLDDLAEAILAVSETNAQWSDAFGLAFKLNLDPTPTPTPGVDLIGDGTLEYDQYATPDEQQRLVAYGVVQWAMREWELRGPCVAVRYVAELIVRLPHCSDRVDAAGLLRGLASA